MVGMVFFLKPDAVVRRYVGARTLKELLKLGGMRLLSFNFVRVDKDFLADVHYAEHKGKPFHPWLVEYNTITPLGVLLIETDAEGIETIRKLLGPTLVQKAFREAPHTIRGRYGVYAGANVAHASDSLESGEREFKNWTEYLMSKGVKVRMREEEVVRVIEEYIHQYIDFPMVDVARYIEIAESFKAGKIGEEEAIAKLTELFKKESDMEEEPKKLAVGVINGIKI